MSKIYEVRIRYAADSFTLANKRLAAVKRVLKTMSEVMGLRLVVKAAVRRG